MKESTAQEVCKTFVRGWVPTFGLPTEITSDNGSCFIARLWKDLNATLGTIVNFTPPNHAASLGGLERLHRDLKVGLRASLHHMADTNGSKWMSCLPWTLLGRRTAYQPDLQTSPAEVVLGQMPKIPGDLLNVDAADQSTLPDLLDKLRTNAAQPARPTAHHSTPPVYMPEEALTCTHVYVLKGKPAPLGPLYEGPFEIKQRIGKSSLIIHVGNWATGQPRHELQHWNNCIPYTAGNAKSAVKTTRGRKPLNPQAQKFEPSHSVRCP